MSDGTLIRRTENGQTQTISDAIARRGHNQNRIIHTSFKDLIPLRQREDVGLLERPSAEDVEATRQRTQNALSKLVSAASAASKPKSTVHGTKRDAPQYISYTPDNMMGDEHSGKQRIIKIVQKQQDPLEPPKHKHKKIPVRSKYGRAFREQKIRECSMTPHVEIAGMVANAQVQRGPGSPPPPVMHSPPRKLTAEDQEAWRIPPAISNWKNAKGYTIALDKRLASDGRNFKDATINDRFAQMSEALQTADRHAREEVKQRTLMQQRLAEREKDQKKKELEALARRVREDRMQASGRGRSPRSERSRSRSRSRSGSFDSYDSRRSPTPNSDDEAVRVREQARREKRDDAVREMRQSRMGTERRLQQMAREQNRDISEKVALGLAKPSQAAENMYDSRLFNRTSGFNTGFNEDQAYDRPLFVAQDAISSIYRPTTNADDEGEDADATMERIQGTRRFEGLGSKGGEDSKPREGPVQFEKDTTDPFGINDMIADVKAHGAGGSGSKRYGIQQGEGSKPPKRARLDDDDEE